MIYTSPDAQWIAVRRGRAVTLVVGIPPATPPDQPIEPGALTLDDDATEIAFVGAPSALVAISATRVVLHQLPSLEATAVLALDAPMKLAAITGPRFALVGADGKRVLVVRVAGKTLLGQVIDHATPLELVVGLDRNQLLFGIMRRLEVWDAVSARPVLRLQLQLPPPPRNVGAAQGHLWATRPGSDEIFLYRLSDGRPFRHHAGSAIEDVVCHPASPVLILVTARGLVRLHCFAHSLALVDAPWQRGDALAQLVSGSDLFLVGDTWRVAITTTQSGDRIPVVPAAPPSPSPSPPQPQPTTSERGPEWRDALATIAGDVAAGTKIQTYPELADTQLGALAQRLALGAPAQRALIALYAVYLAGEPAVPIAQLARVLDDWSEPLGQGELAARALLRRRGGRVSLRPAVTDLLDGAAPITSMPVP